MRLEWLQSGPESDTYLGHRVQTETTVNSACYPMDAGIKWPECECSHVHPVMRLRTFGVIPVIPLNKFVALCLDTGNILIGMNERNRTEGGVHDYRR